MDYQASHIGAAVGLPVSTVSHWVKQGLVAPDGRAAFRVSGGGLPHLFSDVNVVEFAVCKKLRDAGCSLTVIRELLTDGRATGRRIRWFGVVPPAEQQWIVIEEQARWWVETGFSVLLCEAKADFLVLNLSHIKRAVAVSLAEQAGKQHSQEELCA